MERARLRSVARKLATGETFRFLVGGTANTALSYLAYVALQRFIDYRTAYSIAFFLGVFTGFVVNSYFVFRVPWNWKSFFAYPLIPIANYFISLGLIYLAVERMTVPKIIAPLLVTMVMLPVTLIATRILLLGKQIQQ